MKNTPQEQVDCFSGRNLLGQEFQFWQTRPHAVILCDSVLADCIEKSGMPSRAPVENTILYQRIPTPRPAPKFVSKNAWQVQHDNQAASNRVRRETSSTSPCARSTTECITWRSRSDLDLRLGAYAQNTISNRICHCRREQDRRMQCVRWRIPKDHPQNWERSNCLNWEKYFYENTVPVLCQVLARRTVKLHLHKGTI